MNKKPDQRFMQPRKLSTDGRQAMFGVAGMVICALVLSACTTYRPLSQGASVPWANALAATQGGQINGNRHRVEEGDALSGIANRYDVRLSTLAAANNIESPYILYPGEVLRIPADAPLPARRPEIIETALPAPQPSVLATKPVARQTVSVSDSQGQPKAAVVEGERYVVAEGESLALIAVRHKLTLGDLVTANNMDPPYNVRPGQVLTIPAKELQARWQADSETAENTSTTAATSVAPPLSAEGFMWPVHGDLIGSFEERGAVGRSGGVNIAARKGTPVRASESGIVAYAGEALSGYGHLVMLRHDKGYVTLYAHNDSIVVREGDSVSRGQTIAEVGDTGDVSESQLHFELRKGKAPIDPTKFLAGLPGRQLGKLQ